MKAIILSLLAVAPAAANAATHVTCGSGPGVTFHLIDDRGGIASVGSIVTIVANGVLHTVIDAQVDAVDTTQPGKIVAEVTTVNQDGVPEATSGKATITFGIAERFSDQGNTSSGTVQLLLKKFPPRHPRNIVFQPSYVLTECKGTI